MTNPNKKMPEEAETRVLALLLTLAENKLTVQQAASLYNDLSARIVRIPAPYQIAFAMQAITETGCDLSEEAAERITVLVLYCVCFTDESGLPGYETVSLAAIEHYRAQFRALFDNRTEALSALIEALSSSAQPPNLQ